MHRRLSSLAVALLLPAVQPALLPAAGLSSALLLTPAAAKAQSAEAVARIAQAITVRLEGVGSPGSGVLVKREGNRYTVLTAWHVVSGQNPGEELEIVTSDGKRHPLEQGSIKRIGEVDMAVLSFSSPLNYELAQIGDVKSVKRGDEVFVAGFPADRDRKLKYDPGKLVANADVGIDQGYQLLYTNDTQSGMSGGVVLNRQGELVGMHGRGELDEAASARSGRAIKTGTNQGVPISYYRQWVSGDAVVAASSQATSADDYLAQARSLLNMTGKEQEVIRLSTQSLALNPQLANAYNIRGAAKYNLRDMQGAIADYNKSLAINPIDADTYYERALVKYGLNDINGAIADYDQALVIDPQHAPAFLSRGLVKHSLGDKQGAIADYTQALGINPKDDLAYRFRGNAKSELGDKQGAIADYTQSLAVNSQVAEIYNDRGLAQADTGKREESIADYTKALVINPRYAMAYYNRGNAKSDLGDKQGAIADYTSALAIDHKYAEAYNNRGLVKSELGDNQGAVADFNQALAIKPQDANAWGGRGLARYRLGDRSGACEDMSKSASIGSPLAQRFLLQLCQ